MDERLPNEVIELLEDAHTVMTEDANLELKAQSNKHILFTSLSNIYGRLGIIEAYIKDIRTDLNIVDDLYSEGED